MSLCHTVWFGTRVACKVSEFEKQIRTNPESKNKPKHVMTSLTPTSIKKNSPGLPGWSTKSLLSKDIDRMFDRLFRPSQKGRKTGTSSITEEEDRFEWSVDMPGVGRDYIDVNYNETSQTLSVSSSYEDSEGQRDYHYSVRLGNEIDTENISAQYKQGVLTVRLPKAGREENVRQIEVK